MNSALYHVPVMPSEIQRYLITDKSGVYFDCTLGGGGHTKMLLEQNPGIRIIATDTDEESLKEVSSFAGSSGGRLKIYNDNFVNIRKVLEKEGIGKVNGVLADLGVSSRQFDDLSRGFSFNSDNLDMRMNKAQGLTAEQIINSLDETELADLFYKYGDERLSRRISRAIVSYRGRTRISSGKLLADIIHRAVGGRGKIHPATKAFQALRIAVNREMDSLADLLKQLPDVLELGARACVITFHSLEDRMVKNNFRDLAASGAYLNLTKKVLTPSDEEISSNPRSRSAKLRVAERISNC